MTTCATLINFAIIGVFDNGLFPAINTQPLLSEQQRRVVVVEVLCVIVTSGRNEFHGASSKTRDAVMS